MTRNVVTEQRWNTYTRRARAGGDGQQSRRRREGRRATWGRRPPQLCRANDDGPHASVHPTDAAHIAVKHRLATTTDRFNPRATQNAMRAPVLLSSTLAMGVSASRRTPFSARGRVVSSSAGRARPWVPARTPRRIALAFEDSYDIGAMLRDAKVRHGDPAELDVGERGGRARGVRSSRRPPPGLLPPARDGPRVFWR